MLHNLASASQAKWELATTSNYLEALIYNLQLAHPLSATSPDEGTAANRV